MSQRKKRLQAKVPDIESTYNALLQMQQRVCAARLARPSWLRGSIEGENGRLCCRSRGVRARTQPARKHLTAYVLTSFPARVPSQAEQGESLTVHYELAQCVYAKAIVPVHRENKVRPAEHLASQPSKKGD